MYSLLLAVCLFVLSGLEELGRKLYKIIKNNRSFDLQNVLANGEKQDMSMSVDTKLDRLYKEVNDMKIMIVKLEETVSQRKI